MKLKLVTTIILVLILQSTFADDVLIPKGIRYKKTSEIINIQAIKKLTNVFSGTADKEIVLSLFGDNSLICGPALWKNIKSDKSMGELKNGSVKFKIPIFDNNRKITRWQAEEGKYFQTKDEIWSFWKVFIKQYDSSNLKVRKLNQLELKIYWTMISYDITEPIFIIETKNNKILTHFISPDKLNVMWIDDYQSITLTK